jgi:hypothetical protein
MKFRAGNANDCCCLRHWSAVALHPGPAAGTARDSLEAALVAVFVIAGNTLMRLNAINRIPLDERPVCSPSFGFGAERHDDARSTCA